MDGTIEIKFESVKFKIPRKRILKRFIKEIFLIEDKILDKLILIFCTDEYIHKLNQTFLHHDTYTDVLTFNLSNRENQIQGEIYLSYDRLKENADIYEGSFHNELLRVVFHGVLHLCGYLDHSTKNKKQMTQMEDKYLSKYLDYLNVSRETTAKLKKF